MMLNLSRRNFVKTSLTAASALTLTPSLLAAAAKKLPIALQLYSIRNECSRDLDTALAEVAKWGLDAVEFAGYHKYDGKAKELRAKLDSLNLKTWSTHISLATLKGDQLQKTIDFHQTLGCKYLLVASDNTFTDPEKSKALAETFNQIAEKLKPLGMATGYHNHTNEFKKDADGKTYYELFAERTSKDVILQQDCGWTAYAKVSPAEMMKKYPGRFKSVHFKPTVVDGGTKAYIGQDGIDWSAVYAACCEFGGTEFITLEQETYPDRAPAMEASKTSLDALKKIVNA
jgi:sugar phosphate isomerase/epimerase